jgi:hypothetical protein
MLSLHEAVEKGRRPGETPVKIIARTLHDWRQTGALGGIRWHLAAHRPMRVSAGQKPFSGAPGRNRTCDTRFRKPLLYPLSYEGAS